MVAADPSVLPIGTVIRVRGAGVYSGTYVVTDTGAKVDGKHIDLYVPNRFAAKQFGKRRVSVRVLHWGAGGRSPVLRTFRHRAVRAAAR
jgi:3D (Asp-Asp-Asp) domain-containing protein